jgi:hypothetical protein
MVHVLELGQKPFFFLYKYVSELYLLWVKGFFGMANNILPMKRG